MREKNVPHNVAENTEGEMEKEEEIDDVPIYRKKRYVIPALLMMLGAVGLVGYWYLDMRAYVSTDDAFVDANRVTISSKILGRVELLAVDEGDSVKKGQVLVRLDDSDLRAQLIQAQAALSYAQVSVGPAKSNLDRAVDDFHRISVQFKGGVVPKEQFDHAEKTLSTAQAEYQVALARIQTAKAQLGIVQTSMDNSVITSATDGVVAKRWIQSGDIAQAGQPIYSVYDIKNVWVTANFEETKLTSLRQGQHVDISVDAYPDEKFSGEVFHLGSYTASEFSLIPPNNASGNFTKTTQRVPVKISIVREASANSSRVALLPGMSVEVRVKEH